MNEKICIIGAGIFRAMESAKMSARTADLIRLRKI